MITRDEIAGKIAAWLRHEMTLDSLVDWAERVLQEGEFPEHEASELAAIVARLGTADVRGFGIEWRECEQLLSRLGYTVRFEITAA